MSSEILELPLQSEVVIALKKFDLKDLIETIHRMVTYEAKQRLKIKNKVLGVVQSFLHKFDEHHESIATRFTDGFIECYGLFFRDFVNNKLEFLTKTYSLSENIIENKNSFIFLTKDILMKNADYDPGSLEYLLCLKLDKWNYSFFEIMMELGVEEGFYGNPDGENMKVEAEKFYDYYQAYVDVHFKNS